MAARWIEGPQAAEALETSVRAMIGRGAINAAVLLARKGFVLAPADSHVVLPIFARSGHGGIARILQREWLATRTTLSDAEWSTLSLLAESTGDMRGLKLTDVMQMDVGAMLRLLPRVSDPALAPSEIEALPGADLVALASGVIGLFFSEVQIAQETARLN